ncbi:hypothetical protein [Streptomyces gibsoniae]|uniref:Uncharacterized protein n=1 Tax=Streptomyces gibsoniae TaxID=3075529 RepID=A0ABU2U9S4_9ACTN|nr:hypothetical protein [Streptomyces sp. DSM 41699]MDT0469976.1 hypothetical protein [Streptomyces sp. DSM 41699]
MVLDGSDFVNPAFSSGHWSDLHVVLPLISPLPRSALLDEKNGGFGPASLCDLKWLDTVTHRLFAAAELDGTREAHDLSEHDRQG